MMAQSKTVPYPARSASRWTALLLILLAFALRAYHLDFQSLWSDEGISILRSSHPLGQILRTMPVEHVPGYFLLLHYWFPLAGTGDFALRFPSLIATVLAVAIAYRFGADLGSRLAGLAAALLLATNAFQVWYGQEARMYGWLLATGLASSWLLWRLLRDASAAGRELSAAGTGGFFRTPGRAITFAGYVFCTAASLYLHHYGFLIPISQTVFMLYWLARTRDWRGFGCWVLAGGSVIVLYLPWLPRFLGIFGFPGWRRSLDAGQLPWRYLAAYTAGDPMPAPWHNWLPWLYLALAFFGLYCWWRRDHDTALLLLFTSALPLAGALALALRKPDYHERYTIFITGPLMLLAGMGVVGLGQRIGGRPRAGQGRSAVARILRTSLAGLVLAGLVAANGLALSHLYNDPAAQKADYKTPLHRIEQAELPGDVILLDGPDPAQIFLHYYQGNLPWQDLRPLQGAGQAEVDRVMVAATQGKRRGWLLRQYFDEGPVEIWLAQHGWLASRAYYGGLFFSVYGLPGDTETLGNTGIAFGPGLQLDGVRLAAGEGDTAAVDGLPAVRAGDLLEATMRWRALGPLPALKFSLRLRDATGYIWQSEDYVPQGGTVPTTGWQPDAAVTDRHALWLPADLPPGRYTVTMVVYDPATGAALPAGREGEQQAALGEVSLLAAARPVDPADLAIPTRQARSFGADLGLLGTAVEPPSLAAGQAATLSVWWQALGRPGPARQVLVELSGTPGQFAARKLYPLAGAVTTPWQPGQIVHQRYALELNPAAVTGDYRLMLTPADPSGKALGPAVTAATVRFQARPRLYRLPAIAHPLEARLGNAVVLRGYDVTLPATSGDALQLTLYWQAAGQGTAPYKVFIHLVDDAGKIAGQDDRLPANGEAPAETWLAGEVVIDRHTLARPPSGRYRLVAGMYDPASGNRLHAVDASGAGLADNAVPLGEIAIP